MPLNTLIIFDLLEQLKDYIRDLETMDFTLSDLETDRDIQHLVNHRLHLAVEICIDMRCISPRHLSFPGAIVPLM